MERFCKSLAVKTLMLIGTSSRFSVRLRAVTITSSRVESEDAFAARVGAPCIPAAPDRVAAMANESLVREQGVMPAGLLREKIAEACAAIVGIVSSSLSSNLLDHCARLHAGACHDVPGVT